MTNRLILDNNILFEQVTRFLKDGHDVEIPVKGVSMLPIICENDTVVLEKVAEDYSNVELYSIALFKINNHYILHRIIEIHGDKIIMQGDGNLFGTEICQKKDICGIAVTVKKNGGKELELRSKKALRKFKLWLFLRPVRRYLLFLYRKIFMR